MKKYILSSRLLYVNKKRKYKENLKKRIRKKRIKFNIINVKRKRKTSKKLKHKIK